MNYSEDLLSTTVHRGQGLQAGGPAGHAPALVPPADTHPPADRQFPAHSWEVSWDSSPRQEPRLNKENPAPCRSYCQPSSRPVVSAGCTVWGAMFPRDSAQRGVLLGFSTRHLCCLVCIRLTEPRLLGQPRVVRLDKNNCEEGQEEGLSEAARPCKVTQWVEGLRSCSPRIPCSWLCSEAVSLSSSNPGHFSSNRGNKWPSNHSQGKNRDWTRLGQTQD